MFLTVFVCFCSHLKLARSPGIKQHTKTASDSIDRLWPKIYPVFGSSLYDENDNFRRQHKNEDDPKNQDDRKNKDYPKIGDDPKIEDNLKTKETPKMKTC